jgi:hypothetical protein
VSVLFPEGAWDGGWPDSDAEEVVARDANASVLFAVASAYHVAQHGLVMRTERLTRSMWAEMRPVNDASLSQWMGTWDRVMGTASAQQTRLTESYVRTMLRQFGVSASPVGPVESTAEAVQNTTRWLDSPIAELDAGLHDEAAAMLARLRGNQATLSDLARADRLPWLHSPVIKVRSGLAAGRNVDAVFDEITANLDISVDAALRSAEANVIGTTRWPRFKNGKAVVAKRVPQAGACGWCRVVATRLYSLDSYKRDAAWHTGCRCGWTLATEAEVTLYAEVLRRSQGEGGAFQQEGNYYKAAKAIGVWDGPTEAGSFTTLIDDKFNPAEAFAGTGYISTRTRRDGITEVYDPASGAYRTEGAPR